MRARSRAFSMCRSISEQSSPLLRDFGEKNDAWFWGDALKAWLVCCVWGEGGLPTTRQFRDRLPGSDSDVWYEDQN